jgi:hypothetical protein
MICFDKKIPEGELFIPKQVVDGINGKAWYMIFLPPSRDLVL